VHEGIQKTIKRKDEEGLIVMERLEGLQIIKDLTVTLHNTNKLLAVIAETLLGKGDFDRAATAASLMAERQVSGARSAGGDGGVDVQRFPCANKSWLIARRFPDGTEDIWYEDADGGRRPVTAEEAEQIISG
jgi:hypothetical protein